MPHEETVLPALKDTDWAGASGCVSRRLAEDLDSPYLPWLTFGYDHPHTFQFLSREDFEGGSLTEQQLETEALDNLRRRKASWTRSDVRLGWLKKLPLIVCEDDYLAAERILEVGFMREAHTMLESELLAVGIPRKGILVATDGRGAKKSLAAFAAMVSAQYHRAESAPISPMVFAVSEGRIVGMLAGGEELGKKIAETEAQEDDTYVSGLVVADKETGLEEVLICVGGQDLEKLFAAIQSATVETLQKHLPQEKFGGGIRIVVFGGMTPDTPEVREALEKVAHHLNGVVQDTGVETASGHPVRFRVEWKEDTLTAR